MAVEDQPTPGIADLIASDEYWSGPVIDPMADLSKKEEVAYLTAVESAVGNDEMVENIGNIALSLVGGGSLETLSPGDDFPEPENSRQAIRIIEDSRTVLTRYSRRYARLRQVQQALSERARRGDMGDFDATAELLLSPDLLHSLPAVAVKTTGLLKAIGVERHAHYMLPASPDSKLGICVNSVFVQSRQDLENAMALVIPLVPVGSVYRNRYGGLSKIVRADVVEAIGVAWRDKAPKKPNQRQRDKSWVGALLPKLAHGIG